MAGTRFRYSEVSCPLCGAAERDLVRTHRIVRRRYMPVLKDVLDEPVLVVRCRSCGHGYLNPAPTDESLADYYSGTYFTDDESSPGHRRPVLSAAERLYFAFCRRPSCPSGRLLDVGAGNRAYILWASGRGYAAEGFDAHPYPCVRGAEALPMAYGDFGTCCLEDGAYDIVTLWWVIEHLRRPGIALERARRLLRPGGELIVATTNYGSLNARLWGDYWHHLVLPEHLSQFDMSGLVRLVEASGFRVMSRAHDVMSFDTSLSLWQLLHHRWGIDLPLRNLAVKAAASPFGWLLARLHCSGLITVRARRN